MSWNLKRLDSCDEMRKTQNYRALLLLTAGHQRQSFCRADAQINVLSSTKQADEDAFSLVNREMCKKCTTKDLEINQETTHCVYCAEQGLRCNFLCLILETKTQSQAQEKCSDCCCSYHRLLFLRDS